MCFKILQICGKQDITVFHVSLLRAFFEQACVQKSEMDAPQNLPGLARHAE